jgi:hypothetical protein
MMFKFILEHYRLFLQGVFADLRKFPQSQERLGPQIANLRGITNPEGSQI